MRPKRRLVRDQRAGRGGAEGADDDDANAAAGGEREEMVTGGGEGWAREKGRPGPCAAAWAGGRRQRAREAREVRRDGTGGRVSGMSC